MMELLAPAGTYDCLVAAVNSGADAVYFAGKGFGARSFAGNFSDEEIFRAADFCHLRNVRTYVTVNTLVYDREFSELEKFIKTITRAGADGVIVQDLGVLKAVREISPDIELHGSTQMTIHSADGVRELEELGVSRVVLSRELSGDEIKQIISETSAEAEVFVHGAMCMSYSGQCLMSSVIGGRSGNRGKCAQPCRLPYSEKGKKQRFYLSLKDMSYANHIAELEAAGVASLKIEGRMKGEEYVSEVVSAYRRLIDERRQPTPGETERLTRVFFRGGLTDGYYADRKGTEMFAFDKPDNPYLKNDNNELAVESKQIPVRLKAHFEEGCVPVAELSTDKYSVKVPGDFVVQAAEKKPAVPENVKAQLVKTGGTAFEVTEAEISLKGELFLPVSAVNELRRKAVGELENVILEKYHKLRIEEREPVKNVKYKSEPGRYTCSVPGIERYRAVRDYDFERIYVPLHIVSQFRAELAEDKHRVVISLPVIIRGEKRNECRKILTELKSEGFEMAEISTIDAAAVAEGYTLYGSQRLNITNSEALGEYRRKGLAKACLSVEMNFGQIRDMNKLDMAEIVVYGRIPVMITENCILKNIGSCPCDGAGEITDRTGRVFPVVRDGDECRSVVLNSVPLYLGDRKAEMHGAGADMRMIFTTENEEKIREICRDYFYGDGCGETDYTRFCYFRGALE